MSGKTFGELTCDKYAEWTEEHLTKKGRDLGWSVLLGVLADTPHVAVSLRRWSFSATPQILLPAPARKAALLEAFGLFSLSPAIPQGVLNLRSAASGSD